MQLFIDRFEAIVCQLYYEAGDTKDRPRIAALYIVIALLEKAATVLKVTLG